MDFHTHDPALIDSSNPSSTGNKINYPQVSKNKGLGGLGGNGGFEGNGGYGGQEGHGGGNRYVVSQNSSTQTSTVNGKTTKKTVVTLKYSDGST